MSRQRRRKPESKLCLAPEERERRERDAERWRQRAEAEGLEGLSGSEAGARWLGAKDAGRPYQPRSGWRAKPISVPQTQTLRSLGLNALAYRNAGEASDAITEARAGRKR